MCQQWTLWATYVIIISISLSTLEPNVIQIICVCGSNDSPCQQCMLRVHVESVCRESYYHPIILLHLSIPGAYASESFDTASWWQAYTNALSSPDVAKCLGQCASARESRRDRGWWSTSYPTGRLSSEKCLWRIYLLPILSKRRPPCFNAQWTCKIRCPYDRWLWAVDSHRIRCERNVMNANAESRCWANFL